MDRREVFKRARVVIGRELLFSPLKISEASDFRGDLQADSLDMVTLPRALEDEFDVTLSDDEVAFCQTVGTAIDIIHGKLEVRGRQPR